MLVQAPSRLLQSAFETAQTQALQCSPEARHPTLLMTLHLMASHRSARVLYVVTLHNLEIHSLQKCCFSSLVCDILATWRPLATTGDRLWPTGDLATQGSTCPAEAISYVEDVLRPRSSRSEF